MSSERLFKVLDGNKPAHGGSGTWPLAMWKPGDWLEAEGKLEPCCNGLHLCREGDLARWLGPDIWAVEYDGERIDCDDKIVVRKARLVHKYETWNDRTARLFAVDCAEQVKHLMKDERSVAALGIARRYANGDATREELDAAWDAAGDAAWAAARDAPCAAAGGAAWAATGGAAWGAARAAARAAAWGAAWDAARDAAEDAARAWQTIRLMEYLEGEE